MQPGHSSGFVKIAQEAKKKIKEIELSELHQRLASEANIFLVDVREKEEYQQGCVSWAIHLSKGVPDKTAEIVLYCGGGSRSALAAENLKRMGYSNVYSLVGGYRGICASPSDLLK